MKPFARRGLDQTERVFNYRLIRIRIHIPNISCPFQSVSFSTRGSARQGCESRSCCYTVLHNFLRPRAPSPAAAHSDLSQTTAINDVFREEENACITSMVRCKPCHANRNQRCKQHFCRLLRECRPGAMAVEYIILMWQLRICNLVSYRSVKCVVHHFMVVPLSVVVNACSNALYRYNSLLFSPFQ